MGVKIKEIVALIYAGDYLAAAAKLREDNALPAITGRVCPQENQCEGGCVLGKKGAPVAIGNLERFVADYERRAASSACPPTRRPRAKAWPSSAAVRPGFRPPATWSRRAIACASLKRCTNWAACSSTAFRSSACPSRSSKSEVDNLRRMGVEFETNVVVGKSVTIDELMRNEHYDAVFVATGAGLPVFLGVPGEHLNGVYSANEFLTRVNLMRAYQCTNTMSRSTTAAIAT